MNNRQNLVEFELWRRIRSFFDRNLQFLKSKKEEIENSPPTRRTQRKVGGSGEIRLVPPPKGKPVKGNNEVGVIYAKLETPAQAARANRLNSKLYK